MLVIDVDVVVGGECVCVFVYFEETFLFSKEFCFPHHTHRQTNDKRWKERKASQL